MKCNVKQHTGRGCCRTIVKASAEQKINDNIQRQTVFLKREKNTQKKTQQHANLYTQ